MCIPINVDCIQIEREKEKKTHTHIRWHREMRFVSIKYMLYVRNQKIQVQFQIIIDREM